MQFEKFDADRHDREKVMALLSMAMGSPTPERLHEMLDEFSGSETHLLFAAVDETDITGVISVDCSDRPRGLVTRLAVSPERRKQGIGRSLLRYIADALNLETVELETDQDAVDFYWACGFKVREIDSPYPGIRRFRCSRNMIE